MESEGHPAAQPHPAPHLPPAPQHHAAAEHGLPTGDRLASELAALRAEIGEHHARAAARERVIDHLHAEVERLRAGEQNLVLRPVVTDLQRLRADLLRQAAELPADVRRDAAADLLESFALTVEQALERCGSEPVRPEPGDPFAPQEHRALKALPTADAGLDGTVAAVVADGYRDIGTGRVTTPARVHVHRATAEPTGTEQEQETADA